MKKTLVIVTIFSFLMLSAANAQARSFQRCKGSKPFTAPTESFKIDAQKGVAVKDGLMWKRCVEGLKATADDCEGKAHQVYYADAAAKEGKVLFAGYRDWRLPTIEELKSIVEKRCKHPAMNMQVFPGEHFKLWSKTKVQNKDETMWILYSATGVPLKANAGVVSGVRLVRDIK